MTQNGRQLQYTGFRDKSIIANSNLHYQCNNRHSLMVFNEVNFSKTFTKRLFFLKKVYCIKGSIIILFSLYVLGVFHVIIKLDYCFSFALLKWRSLMITKRLAGFLYAILVRKITSNDFFSQTGMNHRTLKVCFFFCLDYRCLMPFFVIIYFLFATINIFCDK